MKGLLFVLSAIFSITLAAPATCTPERALVRKEWYVRSTPHPILTLTYTRRELGYAERKDYIDALWCLRDRPSILHSEEFPGVRDRWDDFVA